MVALRNKQPPPVKGTPEVEELSRQLRELSRTLPNFATGVMIDVTVSGATAQEFAHGLGRKIEGWIVCRLVSASARTIHELASDDKYLTLYFSGICTARIWVY